MKKRNGDLEITIEMLQKSTQQAIELRGIMKKIHETKPKSISDRLAYKRIKRAYNRGDLDKAIWLINKKNIRDNI